MNLNKIPKTTSWKTLHIFGLAFVFCNTIFAQLSTVSINEINYRSINAGENIDFVELYNSGSSTINLSGWSFTEGIHYKFPSGSSISAGGYLVVASNPSDYQAAFAINGALGPFGGSLSGDSDEVILRDATFNIIDKVDYESWGEWPAVRFLNGGLSAASIQKIHTDLPGNHAGSWLAASPTPKASNSSVVVSNPNTIPIVQNVSKKPNAPTSNQTVKIEAQIANYSQLSSGLTVTLQYQIVDAGSYIGKSQSAYNSNWQAVTMNDNGVGVDLLANDGVYSAEIPSNVQVNRRLVRYRVNVSTAAGYSKIYPDQNHTESNYAYFVYDGQASFNGYQLNQLSPLQEVHLISNSSTVNSYFDDNTHATDDYPGEATLVYRGKVYDHVRFRARGKDSRHLRLKKNLKIDLNKEHPIIVYNDYNKSYKVKRNKLTLSGTWVNDGNSHGLTESLIYKISELTGTLNKHTDYCQLRIIDGSSESGSSGDFRGIYLVTEDFNSDMLEEHGLPDGNIYSYKPWSLSHQGEDGPYGANNSVYSSWNTAMGNSQDGCSTCAVPVQSKSSYENNLDLNLYFNDWVMNEICGNSETNYAGQHSYLEYYNPVTQKWLVRNGDYDNMFGMPEDEKVMYNKSQSLDYRYIRGPLKNQLLNYTDFKIEIANRLRSTLDLLFNTEQLDHLLTSETAKIHKTGNAVNWTDLDKTRWSGNQDGHGYSMNYSNYDSDVINWYRNWFIDRKDHLLNESTSYRDWDVDQNIMESPITNVFEEEENKIPNTPTINYTGTSGYPLDQLTFSTSTFSDNSGSFAALEWRIGEWSNPSNTSYTAFDEPKYEIETKWSSGEINTFTGSFTIPADAQLKVGRSYKIRVRYKDSTNRWSHWSNPKSITTSPAIAPPSINLVINEIMYNPSDNCGVEFIELYNPGNTVVSLDNVKFTEGVDFDFPPNATLAAGSYLVLTNDSLEFVCKYGFSPFGDFKGGLSNSSDELILSGPFRGVIDSLTYFDNTPWHNSTDGTGYSLSLIKANLDNSNPAAWHESFDECGTPMLDNNLCVPMSISPTIADATCNGATDGFIFCALNGGTAPYSYTWSSGQSGSSISSLSAGTYTLTVIDALLCNVSQTFTIGQPAQLQISTSKTDETTYQANDGTASATVSGGMPPCTYSWSNGATGSTINNLTTGTYTVTVTDSNSCTKSETVSVLGITCNALSVNTVQENISCNNASDGMLRITNMQNGSAPYSILWSTGITGTITNNLSAGNYTLNITDNRGCPYNESFTISNPAPITAITSITNANTVNSYDGAIDLTASGGTSPYSYYWSNNTNTEDVTNLLPSSYWVSITDSNGCNQTISNIKVEVGNCLPYISLLNNSILPSGTSNVSNYIETNCIINQSNVIFNAGNLIHLQNGFEVKQGANFEANIDGCN